VEFPYRQNYSMAIRLRLPDGWQTEELPKSTRVTTPDRSIVGNILYELADDNTVAIQYQFRLSRVTYDNSQYDILRQLFDLFASRSKDVIVIRRK